MSKFVVLSVHERDSISTYFLFLICCIFLESVEMFFFPMFIILVFILLSGLLFSSYFNQHFKQMLKWSWKTSFCTPLYSLFCPATMFSLFLLNLKSKVFIWCSYKHSITVPPLLVFNFVYIKTCKNALAFAILMLLLCGYVFSDEKDKRRELPLCTFEASMLVNTMMKNDTYQLKIKRCLFKSIFKHL